MYYEGAGKIAVDIASGISATTGEVLGTAFQADVTVTFGFEKRGQLLYPGAEYTGALKVEDIGFTTEVCLTLYRDCMCWKKKILICCQKEQRTLIKEVTENCY